jgi:archaellum component FlaC
MDKISIEQRISDIDSKIIELEERLTTLPSQFEESTSTDDNAVEGELENQALGSLAQQIESLRSEKADLQAELKRLADLG